MARSAVRAVTRARMLDAYNVLLGEYVHPK